MSRPNPFILAAGFLIFVAAFGGLPLLKGGIYLDTHEGDSYHLLDILMRLQMGLKAHLDFPTPLGFLSFLPISAFVDGGFSVGRAFILAQLAIAGTLLPLVVYAAVTRLSTPLAWLFGGLTLGIVLTLTYGGSTPGVALSMHYNRWAWALAFVAIVLAALPARSAERPLLDGALLGVLGAALALLKATYFVALTPGILLLVLQRWHGRGALGVLAGGAVVAALATLFQGVGFWAAYVSDLVTVTGSEVRPFVGVPFNEVLAGPRFIAATLVGVAGAMMIRRAGPEHIGTAILLLIPGLIYIMYQNFGNDPMWLWVMAILLFALRPVAGRAEMLGGDLRHLMAGAAWVALALNMQALMVNATAAIEHAFFDKDRYIPIAAAGPVADDLYVRKDRAWTMSAMVDLDRDMPEWAAYHDKVEREPLREIGGVTIPQCEWMAGSRAYFETISADLIAGGIAPGSQLFVADILSAFWLFGSFDVLEGGAPWYYGGLTGLENADYVLVPKCSFVARVRGIIVDDLLASGRTFTPVRDNAYYALFEVSR